MAKRTRRDRQLSVPNKGLRYLVMAAMGDIPALRGRSFGHSMLWLIKFGLAAHYRGQETLGSYLARSLYDIRYAWASDEDPLESFLAEALMDKSVFEGILLGRTQPTAEDYSTLAGTLRVPVDQLLDLPLKLEENGDVKRVAVD